MSRLYKLKFALWLIVGLAAAAASARFLFGLGATTHLSDATPWGFWIGFDVMGGVALAAGGFITAAAVHIFKLERFHAVVRPAILTAFLGYSAVAVGLLCDLGLPWNILHMVVFWNPRSPLFEVGWCVMLYLAVLALEFFPVPAEEFPALARVRRVLIRFRLPLVIVGIGLSTLHQSSLGSLFLIMPGHLHPLWYTPLLPLLFLISAIALGLMMVMFESHTTAWLYLRKPETVLLGEFGGAARWVLLAYLALRFGDLAARGRLPYLWGAEWQVKMFWFEIAMMAVIPATLLSLSRFRRTRAGQWWAAALGVLGVVLNRIDVGGLAHIGRGRSLYLPAWTELAISAGIVSAAALAFLFLVERFHVWETRPADPAADPVALPQFDRVGQTWLGVPAVAGRTVYSLAFIVSASLAITALAPETAASRGVVASPAHRARGGEILWIDGNLNGYGVSFSHAKLQQRLGGATSCVKCHHMNLPRDRNSGCWECHSDMRLTVSVARHANHAQKLACQECHARTQPRQGTTAKACDQCHKDLIPAGSAIPFKRYQATGYTQAMHVLCIGCHTRRAKEEGRADVARCADCHKERRDLIDARTVIARQDERIGTSLLMPLISKQ